ncbi:MAG: hypothetical protein COA32_14945 [Fluviicola sp.]|nr:MAG: hypothetical protein COA32_14945 [Fluviicola sp.]
MNTSNNIKNKRSKDAFDRLLFEQKLRAKTLVIDKDLDLLLIVFNTGNILKAHLSDYPKLKKATKEELKGWRLIKNGIGVRWESLDEDLSIKGFIKTAALNQALRSLDPHNNNLDNLAV